MTPADSVGLNQPVAISGLAVPGGWSIVVTDTGNNTVWTTSGTGTTISATWPGPTTDGYFTIAAVATATGNSAAEAVVCNPTQTAQFLMVSCVPEQGETRVIPALIDIANRRGLSYEVLTGSEASWRNIKSALQNTGCKYLYMNCHGMEGGGSNALTFVVITGGDSNYWLYSHHWSDSPNGPQENDPIPANAPFRYAFATDLNRQNAGLTFVWMNACYSGAAGAVRPGVNCSPTDPYTAATAWIAATRPAGGTTWRPL